MSNISVVIPLYNEEGNVSVLQRELTDALTGLDYEIIFVDDGSRDQTVSRIVPDPRIRVLCFEKNAGQSAAIFAGLQAVRSEVAQARRFFSQNHWPVIDVSRRSIEETAAAILKLLARRHGEDT